jgi:hypothetical protein
MVSWLPTTLPLYFILVFHFLLLILSRTHEGMFVTFVHIYIHTYVYRYTYIYIYIYICTCIYIYRFHHYHHHQGSMQEWINFGQDMKAMYNIDCDAISSSYQKEQKDYYIYSSLWTELRVENVIGEPVIQMCIFIPYIRM